MDFGRSCNDHRFYTGSEDWSFWSAIVMVIAQQVESNLITPNVMGKSLDIHPLTVITVILAAGNIAGFLGIIVAIPTYAVGKAIVKNIYARR